ncbi:MAG TPA: VCBS repeat-containing protein [Terriglobales bacterium]|jgi:hypothetical protein
MRNFIPQSGRSIGLIVLALVTLASGQSGPTFVAHRDYVSGDLPRLFAAGDLNNDGEVDLVLPNATLNFSIVSVVLGNHDGSFQAPLLFDSGGVGGTAAAVADFNEDGKQDAAVTTLSGVSILLGDGQGGLGSPRRFVVGNTPAALVAGDFNGDTHVDLAVANFASNNVSILLGNGRGTFRAGSTLTVGRAPLGIVVGDFNHDGDEDLAVANSNQGGGNPGPNGNTVAILLGAGDGTFGPATFIPVARGPIGIAAADVNGDTQQDVVVTNSLTEQVSVLLGLGNGSFQAPTTFTVASGGNPAQGFFPSYVAVTDFNGDGKFDLAVANPNTSTIALLPGNGQGSFGAPTNTSVGRTPVAVITGDFNHDGRVDFVTSNEDGNTVSVVFGRGNGKFLDAPSFRVNASPTQIVTADFNEDGLADLGTVNAGNSQDGRTVSILMGLAGGGFANQRVAGVGNNPLSLATADLNNDGHADIVAANFGKYPSDPGSVSLLLGRGNGTFIPAMNFPAGDFPDFVAAADFNGDGNQDLAVADFGTNVGVGGISILLGNGSGGFAAPVKVGPDVDNVFQVLTGDFNRDGKADIAFSSRATVDSVAVLLGSGNGSFGTARTVAVPFFVFTFTNVDFNQDGILDFGIEEGGVIETLLGDGQGNFASQGTFDEGEAAIFSAIQSLAVGDFNGDGFQDIAAPDVFSDNVSIMLGNGDGTLTQGGLFTGAPGGRALVADFNRDNRPDLAVAATDSRNNQGKVIILMNRTR